MKCYHSNSNECEAALLVVALISDLAFEEVKFIKIINLLIKKRASLYNLYHNNFYNYKMLLNIILELKTSFFL